MTRTRSMLTAIAVAMLSSAAFAQNSTAGATAADAQEQPVTQSMNQAGAASAATANAENDAQRHQYDLDRAAFRAEVATRKAKILDDQIAYERQQAAYADAMAAWRIQSDACKAGSTRACKAPTPVPADFMQP